MLQKHSNFTDRINLYHSLGPMNFRDTRSMIRFRLKQSSGGSAIPTLFTYPALWSIYRATGGYPRKIINLCHQSILAMIVENRNKVGWLLVRSSASRLFQKRHQNLHRIAAAAFTGLAAAAIIAVLLPGRLQLPITWKANDPKMPPVSNQAALALIATDQTRDTSAPISAGKNELAGDSSMVSPQKRHATNSAAATGISQQLHQKESRDDTPGSAETDSGAHALIPAVQLETIRGAIHGNFFRIVFQFTEKVLYEKPVMHSNEVAIRLKKVTTELAPFRKYKTFDAWVKLDKNGNDLNVSIGFPENFLKLDCFELKNPFRLVINIFTMQPGALRLQSNAFQPLDFACTSSHLSLPAAPHGMYVKLFTL
ncbi:MAG: hypothetical protein KKE59_04765 [Proteobacteria bacterium]|nr:hypothetical protein [Pseudomonadota bacterium]